MRGKAMTDTEFRHVGIIQSLIMEFETHRLPRLFKLKDSVDHDHRLSDIDIAFLDYVIHDTNRTMTLTIADPELHEFCMHLVHLYHDITTRALENEKAIH
jgi:hypothetical protein